MPKDQKKKRKRTAVQPAAALGSGGPSTSQQTVSQVCVYSICLKFLVGVGFSSGSLLICYICMEIQVGCLKLVDTGVGKW